MHNSNRVVALFDGGVEDKLSVGETYLTQQSAIVKYMIL